MTALPDNAIKVMARALMEDYWSAGVIDETMAMAFWRKSIRGALASYLAARDAQTRRKALEDAARVCEAKSIDYRNRGLAAKSDQLARIWIVRHGTSQTLATDIRALRPPAERVAEDGKL